MIESLINSEQSYIDSFINQHIKHPDELIYEKVVIPSVRKIISAFSNIQPSSLPIKHTLIKPFDIYAESLTIHIIQHPEIAIPTPLLVFVIIAHPFMLQLIQYNHNFTSWDKLRIELVEAIDNDFSSIPQAKQIRQLLETQTIDTSLASAFHLFHYLYGFYYKPETTGKPASDLIKFVSLLQSQNPAIKKLIIISINSTYNILRCESVICYNDVPRSTTKILNESTIETFKSFTPSPCQQKPASSFDILDTSFGLLSDGIPADYTHALVLINYNNAPNYKNNIYTVAHFGPNSVLEKKQVRDFISYKAIRKIPNNLLVFHLEEAFYANVYKNDFKIESLKRSYTRFMNTISTTFNTTNSPSSFIEKLIINVKADHSDLIPHQELKWFTLYLSKLKRMNPYDLQTVIQYVLSYVYPDLLASSQQL